MVSKTMVAHVAVCLLAAGCLHPASAATLLPNTIPINGTAYSQQVTLSEVKTCNLKNCVRAVPLQRASCMAVRMCRHNCSVYPALALLLLLLDQ